MKNIKFEVLKKVSSLGFYNKELKNISKIDSVSPPSVFIGSKLKYPLVNIGILSPLQKQDNAWIYDDSKYWAENNFSISDVIKLRGNLLNSRFQSKVYDAKISNKLVDIAKDIAISLKPVDIEVELKRKPFIHKKKDKVLTPHSLNADLKKARIVNNVKVHRKVDKVINDDIKSQEGMEILYKSGFNEYALSKILSVGVLGLKKQKRFVPTRWSITATDDFLGNNLLKKIRDYKWVNEHKLFFGEFLGNCYLIMLFPSFWSYELFELYLPKSAWNTSNEIKASTDREGFYGRKNYAFNCVGGYYACRLPIIEYLNNIKRQAGVLVIRIETPDYWSGLGVWVVRESVRKALNKSMNFKSLNELIESVKKISKIKYNFDCHGIFNKSYLLKEIKTQKNLREWI
jgi:hypothetical protein